MDFGVTGVTRRGQPCEKEHGRPLSMLWKRQLVDIRKRSFTGLARESELPIVPLVSQGQHNLERGKGQYLHHASEGGKERQGDCGNAINSECSENFCGSYTGRPSESECLWKKMIEKPYSGKPNVRFDEGELEMESLATTPALYSTEILYIHEKS